jgi:hypothetical protein
MAHGRIGPRRLRPNSVMRLEENCVADAAALPLCLLLTQSFANFAAKKGLNRTRAPRFASAEAKPRVPPDAEVAVCRWLFDPQNLPDTVRAHPQRLCLCCNSNTFYANSHYQGAAPRQGSAPQPARSQYGDSRPRLDGPSAARAHHTDAAL